MNTFKKITAIILVAITLAGTSIVSVNASSYKDVDSAAAYADSVEALTTYGIVSGYAGYFNPGSYVTRAEFAKMVTLASGLEDEVYSNAAKRRFDDVLLDHWGNGYINTSAENKLIVGYPNGLFMPEKQITFAEAVTVLLRAMNYQSTDLGDNWPYAYMTKAKGLGITDGINLGNNSYITRGDLAIIINRALQSKINGSDQKLISKMNIKMTGEVLIVATKNEDSSLQADEVKTSGGTYTLANTNLEFEPLTKAELVLDDDGKVINFNVTYTPKRISTTVDGVVDGMVYFENGSTTRSLGVTDSTSVYNEGALTNYGSFKSNIEDGAAVSILYDESGRVGYLIFNDASYTEGVVIRTDVYAALESVGVSREVADTAKVIRDGETASLSDAQKYDVVYYLEDSNTIYLYCDKISGVYNEAIPNKSNVQSVNISGNVLELETKSAAYKLGEGANSYKLNSSLTALLGRNGKIVDVVDINHSSGVNYGILLSYGTEISEDMFENGKQYRYINVLNGEGNQVKYKTLGNYSERIGDIGKLSFDADGYATFATLRENNSVVSGEIDKNNRKIGDRWLTKDCVILERTYAPSTRTGTATAKVIDLEEIPLSELKASNILYSVTSGDFGDISLLIVEGVTGEDYSYGILTSNNSEVTSASANGSYTILINGEERSFSTNFASNIKAGTAVAATISGNSLVSLKSLVSVKNGTNISAIDFTRVKVGNDIYKLADDVQIFKKSSLGKGYTRLSVSDTTDLIGKTANLYADKAISSGGMIRVITIN